MPEEPADRPRRPPVAPELSVMQLVDVTVDLPDTYALAVLQEQDPGGRTLHIPLGIPDATSLAHALRRLIDRIEPGGTKPVDLHARRVPIPSGGQRSGLGNARALIANRRHAAHHHIIDQSRIEIEPIA